LSLYKLARILHKHHIVFVADRGEATQENLIVVCPNCHSLIHSDENPFSLKGLREAKEHWAGLASVVPFELAYDESALHSNKNEMDSLRVPFSLESLGLAYIVTVPHGITVVEFLLFIVREVLTPVGEYDGNPYWVHPDRVELSHLSNTHDHYEYDQRLADIPLHPGDSFVAIVHEPSVAAPARRRFTLSAEPTNPKEGQAYLVVIRLDHAVPGVPVEVHVEGTDGYGAHRRSVTDSHGTYAVEVPGARARTVDSILAVVEGKSASGRLVFGWIR